jgi:hypothetical protein
MMSRTYKSSVKDFRSKRHPNVFCAFIMALAFPCLGARAQSTSIAPTSAIVSNEDGESQTIAQARIAVQKLFDHSGNITCSEAVTQFILDNQGRPAYQEHSLFNYRIQADTSGKSLKFVESREPVEAPFRDRSRTVLITDGFGNMLLILHPAYQRSFTFEADGNEVMGGVNTIRYRFRSVAGAPSPIMVRIRDENYSVSLDGTVWIEPGSGNVVKLIAASRSGMNELGIQSISSEIEYLPASFKSPDEYYWVPSSAVIDVETPHRHWRNVHTFSAYKRFEETSPARDFAQNQ